MSITDEALVRLLPPPFYPLCRYQSRNIPPPDRERQRRTRGACPSRDETSASTRRAQRRARLEARCRRHDRRGEGTAVTAKEACSGDGVLAVQDRSRVQGYLVHGVGRTRALGHPLRLFRRCHPCTWTCSRRVWSGRVDGLAEDEREGRGHPVGVAGWVTARGRHLIVRAVGARRATALPTAPGDRKSQRVRATVVCNSRERLRADGLTRTRRAGECAPRPSAGASPADFQ